MKKHLAFYLGWSAFLLLLAGCEQSDSPTDSEGNGKPVTVDFTVAGIADYGDNQTAGSRAANPPAPFSVSTPINDEYEMEATFTPDSPATSRAAATRAALGEGIYYRVIAYKENSTYVGHADYKIVNGFSSLVGNPLTLEGGTYEFFAYSYSNNEPITDDATVRGLYPTADNDVLWWGVTKTISADASLSISFVHLFAQIKVKFDATELGSDFATASATFNKLPTKGSWLMQAGPMIPTERTSVPVSFSNVGGQTIVSDYCRFVSTTESLELAVNASFGPGGGMTPVNKTLQLANQNFAQSYSYTCTVKFKTSKPGISLDGNDATGYPYGGGNCWLIHPNLAPGTFSFDATKEGQSTDPIGTIVTPSNGTRIAKVVWESTPGMISKPPTYKDGRIAFGLKEMMGNAILAVTDGTGKVLWSWHIWVADVHMTSSPNPGDFLESNLGSLNYKDPGLFYQFGRKDPMRRESGVNQVAGPRDVAYSVQNPDKFITDSSYPYNWCTTSVSDNWIFPNAAKFNPCPKGYNVPSSGDFSGISSSNGGTWDSGYWWPNKGGGYKAGGDRNGADGIIHRAGTHGNYWTNTKHSDTSSYMLYFNEKEVFPEEASSDLAGGQLIRCVRQ